MTTGLERKAHRLVELARAGDDPSASQLLSLHGAVTARIAAEGAIATGTTATVKVASTGALMKGLVAAAAIATGAAGFFALQDDAPPPVPAVAVRAPPPVHSFAPPPTFAPEPAAPVSSPEPPAPSRAVRPSPGLRLQDEAALLAEVQGALRAGNPQLALAGLKSYDRRFAGGVLRAEADAARVFALCASGLAEKARASAARFVQRYPGSPAVARVQAACK